MLTAARGKFTASDHNKDMVVDVAKGEKFAPFCMAVLVSCIPHAPLSSGTPAPMTPPRPPFKRLKRIGSLARGGAGERQSFLALV